MIPRFQLHRPTSLDEAVELLGELDEVACYAGGTELVQVMKMGFAQARHLVDLKRIDQLDGITDEEDGTMRIGATVTHRTIGDSQVIRRRLPALCALEHQIANIRIRNVGTIGGNLCFAEPHSDPATLLLACDASVGLAGGEGRRTLSLDDFLLDAFTTAREETEIMTHVSVPPMAAGARIAYHRLALTERPTVSVACRLDHTPEGTVEDPRIVIGSVGPRPIACAAPAQLRGLDSAAVAQVADEMSHACASEVEPLDELELSPAYRQNLVAVMVRRALGEAIGAAT